MEVPFQIVGCLLSSKPSDPFIDGFVTAVRRERAVVTARHAHGATFVRFNVPDAKLVAMACAAAAGPAGSSLRFGFASGVKAHASTRQTAMSVSNQSMAQARDLVTSARDGEVLVSPQLALLLMEAGFTFQAKERRRPSGRKVMACALDLGALPPDDSATADAPAIASAPADVDDGPPKVSEAGALEAAAPQAEAQTADDTAATAHKNAVALGGIYQVLLAQAEEIARKQGELEARQRAALGKVMPLDDGSASAAPG